MSKIKWIVTIILLILFGYLIIGSLIDIIQNPMNRHYEYIDLDNNKGIAEYCQYGATNNYYRNISIGNMICKLKDGTVLQVKQYREIVEKVK